MYKKKLLIVLFELGHGGAENIMLNIARRLCNNFDVHFMILSDKSNAFQKLEDNVHIHYLRTNRIRKGILKSFLFFRKNKYDIVFFNLWPISFLTLTALFLARPINFYSTNKIIFEHSVLSEQYSRKGFLFRWIVKLSIRLIYNLADKVISVSEGVRKELDNYGLRKVKSICLPNPLIIKTNKLILSDFQNNILKDWQSSDAIKVIAIGSLKQQKNYHLMIKSFQVLNRDFNIDARLLIVGSGPMLDELTKYRDKLSQNKNISFFGSVNNPLPLLEDADLFLMTSKSESFGLSILEALSTGTTVVSTNCKYGPSEILGKDYKYLCDDNENDIARKLYLASKYPEKSIYFKNKASKYNFDSYIDNIIEMINV